MAPAARQGSRLRAAICSLACSLQSQFPHGPLTQDASLTLGLSVRNLGCVDGRVVFVYHSRRMDSYLVRRSCTSPNSSRYPSAMSESSWRGKYSNSASMGQFL